MTQASYAKERKSERVQLQGRVFIHDQGHLFIAPLSNISEGGLFIDKLVSLPEGRPVRIVVKSDRFSMPVQARGTIVRVEKGSRKGSAVKFEVLPAKTRTLITECVNQNQLEDALRIA